MENKQIKVIVKRPNSKAKEMTIEDRLKTYQELVEGYIEVIPFPKDEKFFKKVLDNFAASGIITIVPSVTAHEHNRICGYGGIGRRVRFRF